MKTNNYTELEAQWVLYFDEVGIEADYEPATYMLPIGLDFTPTFYLPEMNYFVQVNNGPLNLLLYEKARELVRLVRKPLIVLDRQPDFTYYESVETVSQDSDEIDISVVNMVQDPKNKSRFLTWCALSSKTEFEEAGFLDVVPAIEQVKRN